MRVSKCTLIVILVLSAITLLPHAPTSAQTPPGPGKFYAVTYDPVTEENRYRGQTATVWEADVLAHTARQLVAVEPTVNQSPRELFPESELSLLEDANFFPPDRADTSGVIQGLARIVVLDEEHLLVVTYREVHEVMYNTSYGYYDLQLLNLLDSSLTSIMIITYHQSFVEESWNCHISQMVGFDTFQPNPVSATFAFTVVPVEERGCGRGTRGQSYIVDYSTLPVQVEVLPYVRELSWSPDGSKLAYIEIPWNGAAAVKSRTASSGSGPHLIYQYTPRLYYRSLVTWLDNETILYQSDESSLRERPYWAAYNTATDEIVFDEELQDGEFFGFGYLHGDQSHLVWGLRAAGLEIMQFSGTLEIVDTLPFIYLSSESQFRQYAFFGPYGIGNTAQFLTIEGTLSTLDLTWFEAAVGNRSIKYLVPGPPA